MKKIFFIVVAIVISHLSYSIEPHFMEDPAISPDGTQVCFSYMNDLWIVPFEGGEAKRITVSDAYESDPVYSADGKNIVLYVWYDNEYGYSRQVMRLAKHIAGVRLSKNY